MRIGIDGACLSNRRGFGRFARESLKALARAGSRHEFKVFVDRPSIDLVEVPSGFETVPVEVREAPSRAASANGRRGLRDMLAVGRSMARSHLDLAFFPASYSFVPVWNVGKVVVTMHDTLALAHPELVFPTRAGRIAWAIKEHVAVLRADRILTVSDSARRDLIDWFRLPERRVRVVTEGPDDAFHCRPFGAESDAILRKYTLEPGERFFLYVGGLSPHKNLPRLVEALARAGRDDARLILVGDLGDVFHTHVPELRAVIERLGLGHRVHLAGFVPDDELAYLYSRAFALVQPSLMEGFGLPPVEAMACGTPVLSSTAGSLPEVVGPAGRFFDPRDIDAIARSMRELLDDPAGRDRLAEVAARRAGKFTWDASARSMLDCFEELAPKRDRPAAPHQGPSSSIAGRRPRIRA
ncbi:glycosyltransferase family 1 protein [Isosphaeraceae bacterium EP7]